MNVGCLVHNGELGFGIVTESYGQTQVLVDFHDAMTTMIVSKSSIYPNVWKAPHYGPVALISKGSEKSS